MQQIEPPAPRPCDSCPYRRDVPSGVWAESEYRKLAQYDAPTGYQPLKVFQCHQLDRQAPRTRVCAGWAGCHDGDELAALRIAVRKGLMTAQVAEAVRDYVSPVPLFLSGAQAAEHGLAQLTHPGPQAAEAIAKIERARSDLPDRDTPAQAPR
jgi:hypothetical protein